MSARGPFSSRAVLWITAVSVVSFLLAFVLAAVGDDLVEPTSAGPDSFSYSALGHRAFVDLLARSGYPVLVRRSRVPPELDGSSPLLVLEPRDPDVLSSLHGAHAAGATAIVVAPKWAGTRKPLRPEWLERVWLLDETTVVAAMPGTPGIVRDADPAAEPCALAGSTYDVSLAHPQWLVASNDLEPLVTCGERLLAASGSVLGARVVLVSDPDLLNNHGIADGENAALMLALLRSLGARRVVVDETHHGFARGSGLIAELLRFPMVLVVIQGLLVVGLAVWAGSSRAGKPLPFESGEVGGTSTLIDNAAQLLARGGHAGATLRRYYDGTLRTVGRHFFVPADLARGEQLDRLERLASARGVKIRIRTLDRRLSELETAGGVSTERAVKLAGDLYRWRQEMVDGARKDS